MDWFDHLQIDCSQHKMIQHLLIHCWKVVVVVCDTRSDKNKNLEWFCFHHSARPPHPTPLHPHHLPIPPPTVLPLNCHSVSASVCDFAAAGVILITTLDDGSMGFELHLLMSHSLPLTFLDPLPSSSSRSLWYVVYLLRCVEILVLYCTVAAWFTT